MGMAKVDWVSSALRSRPLVAGSFYALRHRVIKDENWGSAGPMTDSELNIFLQNALHAEEAIARGWGLVYQVDDRARKEGVDAIAQAAVARAEADVRQELGMRSAENFARRVELEQGSMRGTPRIVPVKRLTDPVMKGGVVVDVERADKGLCPRRSAPPGGSLRR